MNDSCIVRISWIILIFRHIFGIFFFAYIWCEYIYFYTHNFHSIVHACISGSVSKFRMLFFSNEASRLTKQNSFVLRIIMWYVRSKQWVINCKLKSFIYVVFYCALYLPLKWCRGNICMWHFGISLFDFRYSLVEFAHSLSSLIRYADDELSPVT